VWYTRLKDACAAKPDAAGRRPPRLVADVGANFGYYSLYAASLGCRRAPALPQAALGAPAGPPPAAGNGHAAQLQLAAMRRRSF